MLFELNSVCLKITTDGKHKGETKYVQQQILAYHISVGGRNDCSTAYESSLATDRGTDSLRSGFEITLNDTTHSA
jgi:hypothetical protein